MEAFIKLISTMDLIELQEFRNLIELDIVNAMRSVNEQKYLFDYRDKIRKVDTEIFNRTNPELFTSKT